MRAPRLGSPVFGKAALALALAAGLVGTLLVAGTARADEFGIQPGLSVPYVLGDAVVKGSASTPGCGRIAVVGDFTAIHSPAAGADLSVGDAFLFDEATGRVTRTFAGTNGAVWSVYLTEDCDYAYFGGDFTVFAGHPASHLAKFNLRTGQLVSGFTANGAVTGIQQFGPRVFVAGRFTNVGGGDRAGFASLNPATGALGSYAALTLRGDYWGHPTVPGRVDTFAINPAGNRLVLVGQFDTINTTTRVRIAMLALTPTHAVLDPWYPQAAARRCSPTHRDYIAGVAWAPAGGKLYLAATGGWGGTTDSLCDAVTRFSIDPTHEGVVTAADWANYTAGDSLFTVAATAAAVYVGGHQKYLDNETGISTSSGTQPGPGAVARPGIGAVDPTTGRATTWNPTRSRGRGAFTILITAQAIYVGSDCAPADSSDTVSAGQNWLGGGPLPYKPLDGPHTPPYYHPCFGGIPRT